MDLDQKIAINLLVTLVLLPAALAAAPGRAAAANRDRVQERWPGENAGAVRPGQCARLHGAPELALRRPMPRWLAGRAWPEIEPTDHRAVRRCS